MFNFVRIALAVACFSLVAHAQTTGTYTTFGTGCQGSNNATPSLSNAGVPEIGKAFRVEVTNARASTGAGLITGSSTTAWGPLQLPADLKLIGADGCTLYVSFESLVPFATDATGKGGISGTIPNDRALVGVRFHQQIVVLDSGANATDLVWTNGGTGSIGG